MISRAVSNWGTGEVFSINRCTATFSCPLIHTRSPRWVAPSLINWRFLSPPRIFHMLGKSVNYGATDVQNIYPGFGSPFLNRAGEAGKA